MGGRWSEEERSGDSQPCAVTDNHQKTAKSEARAEPNVPLRLGDGSRSIKKKKNRWVLMRVVSVVRTPTKSQVGVLERKKAQWLRMLAVLPEDLVLFPGLTLGTS